MRISIIAFGSRGDVQPHIALGVRLSADGHSVAVVTHTIFEAQIRRLGLDFFPIAGDPREIVLDAAGQAWLGSGNNFLHFFRRFSHIAQPLIHQATLDCWHACQGTEAMIFSPIGICAAYSVAEKLGIPFWIGAGQPLTPTTAFASPFFPQLPIWLPVVRNLYNRLTHETSARLFWQLVVPSVNKARQDVLNLPPLSSNWLYQQVHQQRFPILYYYSPSVLPQPSDWRPEHNVITGYWFLDNHTDWQPPTHLLDFLASGPPPVYVGFGSMHPRNPAATTEIILQALARSRQRGILLTSWGDSSHMSVSDDVFTLDAVPHDWLFPQMAAIVHHGGAGTMAASLRAGVPSVLVPFFGDQPFWGHHFFTLGIIPKPIPQKHLSVERLTTAIHIATSDQSLRTRVVALSERIRIENGVEAAIAALHLSEDKRELRKDKPSPLYDTNELS